MRSILILVAILLVTTIMNCNRATLSMGKSTLEEPTYTNRTWSYVLGYYEWGETKEAECEEGKLARIEIKRGFFDTVIHILAGGIATSRTQEIYCE